MSIVILIGLILTLIVMCTIAADIKHNEAKDKPNEEEANDKP